jgi:microsomal dipeptidase-like Zn-dependent dipeptidase
MVLRFLTAVLTVAFLVPSVAVAAAPDPPSGVRGDTSMPGHVTLTWRPSVGATGYRIYRSVDPLLTLAGFPFPTWQWAGSSAPPPVATVSGPPFVDAGLPGLVRQFYVVTAVNHDGESAPASGFLPSAVEVRVTAPPDAPVFGFADLHSHAFANEGFGGELVVGQAFGRPDLALQWCTWAHGAGGIDDLIGNALRSGNPVSGHPVGGWDLFDGWPNWNDFTHQQMYSDWLKRAHDGGLRLLVVHAVNNKVLCQVNGDRFGDGCDDMAAVDRQIIAARQMESFIDGQSGGLGKGFFRIAYSADQARQIINRGGLAVVLGIEVDELFGCGVQGTCSAQHVLDELDRYHAMGVRHLFPIHVFDNAFGGAAMYESLFDYGNKLVTGSFFNVAPCPNPPIGPTTRPDYEYHRESPGLLGSVIGFVLGTGTPPTTTFQADCNASGLTGLGEILVRQVMRKRMIIDIDHMSAFTADRVLTLAEGQGYPVVAGHTGVIDASLGAKRHEGQKTAAQLARIRALGGLVAPILHQGSTDGIHYEPYAALNDCSNSSKTWAQAYLAAVDAMGGPATAAVGLGSDFNGLAGLPGPRFGREKCSGDVNPAPQGGGVSYPFAIETPPGLARGAAGHLGRLSFGAHAHDDGTAMRPGYDYNYEGLAHAGLLPDFVADLRSFVPVGSLSPLFRSAEAYLQMWERIERKSVFPPTVLATTLPDLATDGWQRGNVTVRISGIPNLDGGSQVRVRYSAGGATVIGPTESPESRVDLEIAAEGITTLTFAAFDETGSSSAEETLTLQIDRTGPVVTCAAPESAWQGANVGLGCSASDALSGLADPPDLSFTLQTGVAAGVETADAFTNARTVADGAGNSSIAGPIGGNRIDRKAPGIAIAVPGAGPYVVNQFAVVSYSCADGGSGVASCVGTSPAGERLDTATPGAKTLAVDAADAVGNASRAERAYSVTHAVCLLYDAAKVKKAGSTVPVKVQLCDAVGANLSRPDLVLTALDVRSVSSVTAGVLDDSGSANPDFGFRYDPTLAGYIYNLSTKSLAPGTWELRFRVAGDPAEHAAPFQLR